MAYSDRWQAWQAKQPSKFSILVKYFYWNNSTASTSSFLEIQEFKSLDKVIIFRPASSQQLNENDEQ